MPCRPGGDDRGSSPAAFVPPMTQAAWGPRERPEPDGPAEGTRIVGILYTSAGRVGYPDIKRLNYNDISPWHGFCFYCHTRSRPVVGGAGRDRFWSKRYGLEEFAYVAI
jgi:hypothetical protein